MMNELATATPGRVETEWSENLDSFSTLNTEVRKENESLLTACWQLFDIPFLLVGIGFISAIIAYSANFIVTHGAFARTIFLGDLHDYYKWTMYCFICVCFTSVANLITQAICPQATGGGLPEMKTILGGVVKPVLLSKKLIVAKFVGLVLTLLGGLSVGKEGPFVHISAAVADQLMRLPIFSHVRRQDGKRLEIISCACASAVSSNFGAAFGGVLFSIELTSSAYRVKNLPKACLTAVIALVVFMCLGGTEPLAIFSRTRSGDQAAGGEDAVVTRPEMHEVLGFAAMGVFCGLLGASFVTVVQALTTLRNGLLDLKTNSKLVVDVRRGLIVAVVTLVVAVLMYAENALSPPDGGLTIIDGIVHRSRALHRPVTTSLLVFFLYKVVVTALSVTLPLPLGLFLPVFVTGGVLGRIVGEVLTSLPGATRFAPWEYTLIGAAAYSTGVVRTISTVVILFEVSGHPHLLLPIAVAVLCAHFTGNRLTGNIYEVLMHTSNTPYLKELPRSLYSVPVSQVMVPMDPSHVLTLSSTYRDAVALLEVIHESTRTYVERAAARGGAAHHRDLAAGSEEDEARILADGELSAQQKDEQIRAAYVYHHVPAVIPVVQSRRSMVIVGAVLRSDLKKVVTNMMKLERAAQATPVKLGREYSPSLSLDVTTGGGATAQSEAQWPVGAEGDGESGVPMTSISGRQAREFTGQAAQTGRGSRTPISKSASFHRDLSAGVDPETHLEEPLQFVVLTDDGRGMKPIRNAALHSRVYRRETWRSMTLALPLDTSPYQVVDSMQLSKVDMLFRMLSLNQAYVTSLGRLVGLVTRASLREFIGDRVHRPTDRFRDLWRALRRCCSALSRKRAAYREIDTSPPPQTPPVHRAASMPHIHYQV